MAGMDVFVSLNIGLSSGMQCIINNPLELHSEILVGGLCSRFFKRRGLPDLDCNLHSKVFAQKSRDKQK